MMTRSLCCVSIEMRNLPTYNGLGEVYAFLDQFEREVLEKQRFKILNWVLRATPTRWCGAHKGNIDDWRACRRMIRTQFGKHMGQLAARYNGQDGLRVHLSRWVQTYGKPPALMRMNFAMGIMDNKHVLGGKYANDSSRWNERVWKEWARR